MCVCVHVCVCMCGEKGETTDADERKNEPETLKTLFTKGRKTKSLTTQEPQLHTSRTHMETNQ